MTLSKHAFRLGPDYLTTLARAFELDSIDARARGDFDCARLAEECAHAVRQGNAFPLRSFRGLGVDP